MEDPRYSPRYIHVTGTSPGYYSGLPVPQVISNKNITESMFMNNIDYYINTEFKMKDNSKLLTMIKKYFPKQFIFDSVTDPIMFRRPDGNLQLNYLTILNILNKYVWQVSEYGGKIQCIYSGDEIRLPWAMRDVISHNKSDFNEDIYNSRLDAKHGITKEDNKMIEEFQEIINEEHILPSSIYLKFPPMVYDLHNVFPCRKIINLLRSNYKFSDAPYDITTSVCTYYSNTTNKPEYFIVDRDGYYKLQHYYHPSILSRCSIINIPPIRDDCIGKKLGQNGCDVVNIGPIKIESDSSILGLNNAKKLAKKDLDIDMYVPNMIACNFNKCFFSPANGKGAVARALLYFHMMYRKNPDLYHKKEVETPGIIPWSIREDDPDFYYDNFLRLYERPGIGFMDYKTFKLMAKWHLLYPPSSYELSRNEKIYKLQGNINPFVKANLKDRVQVLLDTLFDTELNIHWGY